MFMLTLAVLDLAEYPSLPNNMLELLPALRSKEDGKTPTFLQPWFLLRNYTVPKTVPSSCGENVIEESYLWQREHHSIFSSLGFTKVMEVEGTHSKLWRPFNIVHSDEEEEQEEEEGQPHGTDVGTLQNNNNGNLSFMNNWYFQARLLLNSLAWKLNCY